MKNEETHKKALEIASKYSHVSEEPLRIEKTFNECYASAMLMAEWKDEQFAKKIENTKFAEMQEERKNFICNNMCKGCKSREMNRLNNCTTLQVYMDCYHLGLTDALEALEKRLIRY